MFSTTKFAPILGSIAALSILLTLAACGGGGSAHNFLQVSGPAITTQPVGPEISSGQTATLTVAASGSGTLSYQWYQGPTGTTTNAISGATSSSYTTPALTATTSYWVQVSDANGSASSNTAVVLIAGPRQVQALLLPSTPNSQYYNSFLANVLPHISGVSVPMQWNQIESNTQQGVYDFSAFDAGLQPFLTAGRSVNLIVWPATEGGDNTSTPSYVFTTAWAGNPLCVGCSASAPQDLTVCTNYAGDSGNPRSGGGIWNALTSSDTSGLPVSYEAPFTVAYQYFIKAVIEHYNATGTIGYIRFGFSQGGENSPECNQYWPNYSPTAYLNYIQSMTNFVAAQNPSMTILEDMHAVGPPGSVDYSYSDTEAADGVADSFGIGTNGLQQSDITNFGLNQPCDSDWCNEFALYAGKKFNGNPITLSLQTLQWTDPTEAAQTGALTQLEPFAKAEGANNIELYLADVGLAFDSANYPSYPHASASVNAASYSSPYAAAIQDFLSPNP